MDDVDVFFGIIFLLLATGSGATLLMSIGAEALEIGLLLFPLVFSYLAGILFQRAFQDKNMKTGEDDEVV